MGGMCGIFWDFVGQDGVAQSEWVDRSGGDQLRIGEAIGIR
jgi:hypothetical protein